MNQVFCAGSLHQNVLDKASYVLAFSSRPSTALLRDHLKAGWTEPDNTAQDFRDSGGGKQYVPKSQSFIRNSVKRKKKT